MSGSKRDLRRLAHLEFGTQEIRIPELESLGKHDLGEALQACAVELNAVIVAVAHQGHLVLDQDLRKRLQLLEGAVGVVRSSTDQLESLALNTTDKYLLENYDFRGIVSLRIGETPAYVEWVDPEENRVDISGIFDDPYFMNLVLLRARLNSAYQRDTNRLLVELADIEALIKSKLKLEGRQQ